jgi:hypothetical protein
MNIKEHLSNYSKNLTINDIFESDMAEYNYFKEFIVKHYSLDHIKEFNYLKYVKIIRQKIVNDSNGLYDTYLQRIDNIIDIMFKHNIFNKIDIKKHLFKISKINLLLNKKQKNIQDVIENYRILYEKYNNNDNDGIKFKILYNLNIMMYKQQLFLKLSKSLRHHIQILIDLEEKYDIDHKLIEINNIERTLLGKKSEYKVEKILKSFVIKNKYIYIQNIDIIKLFKLDLKNVKNMKGEVDGILLYYDGRDYIIDYFIEVKSSIKATYEDVSKFNNLKKCIEKLSHDSSFSLEDILLTKKSFQKIITKHVSEWIIYICVDSRKKIEKSHFYFSNVLKIVDNEFINAYYINNDDSIIDKKYRLIKDNKDYIDILFNKWKEDVNLTLTSSSVYLINE